MHFNTGKSYDLFIDGAWRPSAGAGAIAVRFPYDGRVVARVAEATAEEVEWAVESARLALPAMATLSAHERALILERSADELEARLEEFAVLTTYETGRPIREMRGDVLRAASVLRQSAAAARELTGEMIPTGGVPREHGRLAFTLREPLGVVAAITAFNFPLVLAAHKVGPALGGGNTVVLKPASQTPVSALLFAELMHKAGLPKGALNVVTGGGTTVGERLVQDERVKFVSFTGSVAAGKRIARLAGYKRIGLELGSNSANIVHDDADLEPAVERLVQGAFGASGQSCISVQRIYVHRKVWDEFVERFVQTVRRLRVGDPFADDTDVSALVDPKATERVLELIREAVAEGAEVLTGGELEGGVLQPTVLSRVTPSMAICRQEVFAPVVTLAPYDDLDEAIAYCNDSAYGLQTGIFTRNLDIALEAARRLDTGGVTINECSDFRLDQQPYGGVKDSGIGYEGPRYLIREMTRLKTVSIRLREA